jgi:hypothetical protein
MDGAAVGLGVGVMTVAVGLGVGVMTVADEPPLGLLAVDELSELLPHAVVVRAIRAAPAADTARRFMGVTVAPFVLGPWRNRRLARSHHLLARLLVIALVLVGHRHDPRLRRAHLDERGSPPL